MEAFKTLLLIARPAAGKSEIISYLKNTPLAERLSRFHIGNFEEIDDFPMLWTWFEEDEILTEMGHPALHISSEGHFKYQYLWNLLIERIGLEYKKKMRDFSGDTVILEFSRGSEHGGYQDAFNHLSEEILADLAILYVDVPWEESLRKNRQRFNPDRPDSILEHGMTDELLEKIYKHTDWDDLVKGQPEYLEIKGRKVPYVVFDNTDDVTTAQGEALGERLEDKLQTLWSLYRSMG